MLAWAALGLVQHEHCPGEWVDVDSWCERLGWQENPHHSWYPKAFGARGEAPLKHALLARMAGFVRRCEPAVAVEAA